MDSDYFLPYEIISDDNLNNQISYYDNKQNKSKENIYVGSNIEDVINTFKENKQKIRKRKNKDLVFNQLYTPKKEYFDIIDKELDNKSLSDIDFLQLFIKSIEDLKFFFYCLILGIIIIILIHIINKQTK